MKTLEQFLEATIVPPSDAKRAADNVASSDKMAQKLTQIQQKRQNERIKQGKVSAPAQTRAMKPLPGGKSPQRKALPPGNRGGDLATSKGADIVRQKMQKPGKLALTKDRQSKETQRVRSGSAGGGRATYTGRYGSGTGEERKRRAMEKLKKGTEGKGFGGGLKSSLGGDVFSKDRSVRSKAGEDLGRKTGRAIRSAPGKAVRGAASLVGRGVRNSANQNKGAGSVSDASDTSYNKVRDTQI